MWLLARVPSAPRDGHSASKHPEADFESFKARLHPQPCLHVPHLHQGFCSTAQIPPACLVDPLPHHPSPPSFLSPLLFSTICEAVRLEKFLYSRKPEVQTPSSLEVHVVLCHGTGCLHSSAVSHPAPPTCSLKAKDASPTHAPPAPISLPCAAVLRFLAVGCDYWLPTLLSVLFRSKKYCGL